MADKYEKIDEKVLLGFMMNALSGGGDTGQSFPQSDAEDLSRGLRFIPDEVTVARRKGGRVTFNDIHCSHPCCWYWQFPDNSKLYYWERSDYEGIAAHNGKEKDEKTGNYPDGTGPCPECGNEYTNGGIAKAITDK